MGARILTTTGILIWTIISGIKTAEAGAVYVEPVKMRVTCYTAQPGAITASGRPVMEGTCAGKREWLGKVAMVYDSEMRLIGAFEVTDTGGHPRLKNGTSIDIFRDTLDRCWEWIGEYGDYCYVQIIEAEG